MTTAAILSTRLYGQDGVSVEARKWERAYRSLGCEIAIIAGELGATDTPHVLIPELAFSHPQVVSLNERAFGSPLPASERRTLRYEIEALADTIERQLRAALPASRWMSSVKNFLLLGVDHSPRQEVPDRGPAGAIN